MKHLTEREQEIVEWCKAFGIFVGWFNELCMWKVYNSMNLDLEKAWEAATPELEILLGEMGTD
jgi:hypothetical protein